MYLLSKGGEMEVNWNMLLGDLITQLLRIFLPVAVALILKWAAEIWMRIQEDKPELAEVLQLAARLGYAAAEEYANHYAAVGEDKMEVAVARAEEYLKEMGYNVDLHVIRDAINDYGVSTWKFSWVKNQVQNEMMPMPEESEGAEE